MGCRNGALSGSDLTNEPGLGSCRTYQPGEMPLPTKPRPGLRMMHQEMSSKAASFSSQLKTALPPKRGRVEEKVQTNVRMKDVNETKDGPERVTKILLRTEEDTEMWKKTVRGFQ